MSLQKSGIIQNRSCGRFGKTICWLKFKGPYIRHKGAVAFGNGYVVACYAHSLPSVPYPPLSILAVIGFLSSIACTYAFFDPSILSHPEAAPQYRI